MGRYSKIERCWYGYPDDCRCGVCDPPGKKRAGRVWEKYSSSSDRDTGLMQTDFFSGTVGSTDQKRKVHIAINEYGDVIYVRDMDGAVLYDKKNGIGYLPSDLNWSRF